MDASGSVYVADRENHSIRKITAAGVSTVNRTLLGIAFPTGVAVDAEGNIYYSNTGYNTVHKLTASGSDTIFAGGLNSAGFADGGATTARFNQPKGLAFDASGDLYVADTGNNAVRRITPNGNVSTVAGRPPGTFPPGFTASRTFIQPAGWNAEFNAPESLFPTRRKLYVLDATRGWIKEGLRSSARAPSVLVPPTNVSRDVGGSVTLSVEVASTAVPSYQWQKNGAAIPGATSPTLTINNLAAADAGQYTVLVRSAAGTTTTTAGTITVTGLPALSRIVNLSVRAGLTSVDRSFKVGVVVGGVGTSGIKPLVIRAVGPSLLSFGVTDALADPRIEILAGGSATAAAANDNWGGGTSLAVAIAQVGAFPFSSATSSDAAVSTNFTPRDYVIEISSSNIGIGTVLAEVYDATPQASFTARTSRLVNVSVLKRIVAGDKIVAGFVIAGETSKRVLIRAIGPSLAEFDVPTPLANPRLGLFNASSREIISNDDWGGAAALSASSAAVGAFPLGNPASRDAVLLATLDPGNYTAEVTTNGTTGTALVEIYEVP